jgi:signal transduction histidine kinase
MLSTLRRRLILSHVLPLLVVIPVLGIALIYVLETRVLLADLARELTGEAVLISQLSKDESGLWNSRVQASDFVSQLQPNLAARIMLLDAEGHLLASSDPRDAERVGQPIDRATMAHVLAGQVDVEITYSRQLQTEIVDVWSPVMGTDERVIGAIRLSHHLASVQEQFLQLRYLILGVLTGALVLGTMLGLLLGWNVERPLSHVTQAISKLASGYQLSPLNEQGPQEIRALLRTFNALVQRLHDLEQARRQLLANLVHELGRPLGALQAAIHALRKGALDDIAIREDLLAGMDEETERLQHLLDDLAQLHDQILGTLELDRQPIDLSTWLSHVLAPWREAARKKGLRWESQVPTDLPTLQADADRLARALGNLVSNAIKYTPSRGIVSVKAGADSGAIWIRVSDTGPGITPEEQSRIFTPFYRGRQTGRFPRGMGLGLTIARDLLLAHGGRLEVESTPGQGSRFTMWVPLTPA